LQVLLLEWVSALLLLLLLHLEGLAPLRQSNLPDSNGAVHT